ncbi:MAG: acyl-CoA dehydrogenase family protein, partial [Calditrichaeota bacterium]|nr:acyl-CoA dehydrogenase family protein [Calditrichota bacterium]
AMNLFAVQERNHYLLNGVKSFVINGDGDFWIVAARTDPEAGASGISLFVVDRDQPGLSIRLLETLGWQSTALAELTFENAKVPMTQIIGQENMGYYYINECFLLERLLAAASAVALSEYCLDGAIKYIAQAPDPAFLPPNVRHDFPELVARLESIRQLTYYSAWLYDEGMQSVKQCTMAKLQATEFAFDVANKCMLIYGCNGTLTDYESNRYFRDARMATQLNGSSESMREILARLIIDGASFIRAKALPGKTSVVENAKSESQPVAAEPETIPQNDTFVDEEENSEEIPDLSFYENAIEEIDEDLLDDDIEDDELDPESAEESHFLEALEKAYDREKQISGITENPGESENSSKNDDPQSDETTDTALPIDPQPTVENTTSVAEINPHEMEEAIADETKSEPGHSEGYFSEAADIIEDTTKTDEVAIEPESRKSSGAHAVVANGKAAKQEPAPDVRSIIFSLPERFEAEKAEGFKAVMHFKISGSEGGEFTVNITPKKCQVKEGFSGKATCVVETSDRTYVDMESGKTKAQVAFMMGKVKFSNVPQMMRFIKLFRQYTPV